MTDVNLRLEGTAGGDSLVGNQNSLASESVTVRDETAVGWTVLCVVRCQKRLGNGATSRPRSNAPTLMFFVPSAS